MGEGGKKARQMAAKKSVMYSLESKVIKVIKLLFVCVLYFGLSIGFVQFNLVTHMVDTNVKLT